ALAAAQDVGGGDAAVLQVDFHHGHAADSHLVLVLPHTVAGRPRLHHERRDPPGAPTGLGHGEDRVVGGHGPSGVPLLLAVQDVAVAVLLGASGHGAGVRARLLLG